jgi:hypothetical protein
MQRMPSCDDVECGTNQYCVVLQTTKTSCSKTLCRDVKSTTIALEKREELICPEHLLPLCMFHKCGEEQVCIETDQTATQCPKAKCVPKRN